MEAALGMLVFLCFQVRTAGQPREHDNRAVPVSQRQHPNCGALCAVFQMGATQPGPAGRVARPEAERHIARLQALRRELGMLAAEAEPDRAAIDAKLVEIRGELGLMVAGVQKTAIDAVLALPPEVRQPLASDGQDQP